MSHQPPPDGGPPLPSLTLVDRIIGYVDKPWKILAVIVLAGAAVVGWTLWERRAEIAEAVLEGWVKPRLEAERFTGKFGNELLQQTRADLTVLARITLHENLIQDIDGYKRDEPAWRPPPNPRPVFYAERDPQLLVGLMEGKPICRDIIGNDGEEERLLAGLGMKRRCYVAVPPVLDALVGGLMVAWREPLGLEAESGAMRVLYQAATKLASW
jgi:hypothetical protein